ncbi:MAG TPA: ABC transporter permease [Kofleriaceae bacterium]|nr:ABC transporter permease [Kofleriaceae bacterium]
MRALDRKLLRDLGRMKAQALAIALVVAAGVTLFIMMFTAYDAVRASEHHFYTEQRFAHVWSSIARAPRSAAHDLAAIPGVSTVDPRIVASAILDVPGLAEPGSALIVGIAPPPGHAVNDLYLRRGRHVEPGQAGEVLISDTFAEANRLRPGSTLAAVIDGRDVKLRIVGIALSPEYVMAIAPSGINDDRRFGIVWMDRDQLAALVDKRGAFDDVALRLAPGANERAVIAAVDRVLAPYGGRGAYGRDSQASNTMLEEHVVMLRSLATIVPSVFLLVAAFLVNVVLSRVIATQREQIGMLKAFGYANARIAFHYLELVVAIVALGVVIAVPFGAWLGHELARFFNHMFRFPVVIFRVEPRVIAIAAAIALGAASVGALGALRRVAAIPPIVAMAPEVPAFRRSLLDRLGIPRLLSQASRTIVRNLTRRPLRSVLAATGMAFAIAIVVLGAALSGGVDRTIDVAFHRERREDVSLQLAHPRALGTVRDFLTLPGVVRAEPMRVVPTRIVTSGRGQDVLLVGLPAGGALRHIVDSRYREFLPLRDGIAMTRWLADRMGVRRGDLVTIEIREHRRRIATARVIEIVDEPLLNAIYVELGALGRLLGEPETYSGVNLRVDPVRQGELYASLKRLPVAASVDLRLAAIENFKKTSDTIVRATRQIEILFAIIIAFGVVYNTARIALAERGRELATLRVLGFTRGEVSRILLGEVAALAVPAIPLGSVLGYVLSGLVMRAMSGERMHTPLVVAPASYAFAILVFVTAATVSALVVRRGLDRLDLLATLKARE